MIHHLTVKQWYVLIISMLLTVTFFEVNATHIRAGEIVARRIDKNALTYEFIFIGYRDTDSNIKFGNGTFDFGDGNTVSNNFQITETPIEKNIVRAEFRLVHTFRSFGTYVVSYKEANRNAGISNMEQSVDTPFYVETMTVIDPFLGMNNSPILTTFPIDEGTPGVLFVHNAAAHDFEGDSLSYTYVIPRQSAESEVFGYQRPDSPGFYTDVAHGSEAGTPATFRIDELTGDLLWDSPGDVFELSGSDCPDGVTNCSEYNVAFRVEEWRLRAGRWFRIGYVTRDMQIIIYTGDNEKPELIVPPPVCITAGETLTERIIGTDPDGHKVKMEAFGGPFEVNSAAVFRPSPPDFQEQPAILDFEWQTVCGHVRARPYDVQFKVTDLPLDPADPTRKVGPSLVNYETWEITVVGPKPTGLALSPNTGRSIRVAWDNYSCENAELIQVWRRVGEFPFVVDNCEVGMPAGTGYQLVAEVPLSDTAFVDTNLAPGAKYCYRLVAVFPDPAGGESYVSDEVCFTLRSDAPVITHVDIEKPESTRTVRVQWTPPLEIDAGQFPPPYTYSIYRSTGTTLSSPVLLAENLADTFYYDTGIDTKDKSYTYRISLFDQNGNFVDNSAEASTLLLGAVPLLKSIELQWNANVPWSNVVTRFPYHYIYRDRVLAGDLTQLVLIDSVDVTQKGKVYMDDGRFNNVELDKDIEYCYYVSAQGSYDNPILPEPLINRSQLLCAQPNDYVPPCAPINLKSANSFDCTSFLADKDCYFSLFENVIEWEPQISPPCDDDITHYRIYYSFSGLEEDFVLLDSTTEINYIHSGLPSFKGCYRISALDRSFNESELSETFCVDNCPNFMLPNVFTPNGDGYNDVFTPMYNQAGQNDFENAQCPRFVKEVKFRVFDRSGKQVFDLSQADEPSVFINWDGKTSGGIELSPGVYFYVAEVTFDVLSTSNPTKTYNGWVQILK